MADAREEHVWTQHAKDMSANDESILSWKHSSFRQLGTWQEMYCNTSSEVLDFGCGGGLWSDLFEGTKYTGCDQNLAMIQAASRRRPTDRFVLQESWDRLPFPDESFDMIFTRAVIQHNTDADKELIIPEMVRVLKPGGHYMCAEVTLLGKAANNKTNGYARSPSGWTALMEKHGLTFIEYVAPEFYLYVKE